MSNTNLPSETAHDLTIEERDALNKLDREIDDERTKTLSVVRALIHALKKKISEFTETPNA